MVTGVAEEGHSVSWVGACGREEQLCVIIRGATKEDPGLRDHSPLLRGLNVAQEHSETTWELPGDKRRKISEQKILEKERKKNALILT